MKIQMVIITSHRSVYLGLGSNNSIIRFFCLIIWEFFIGDLVMERNKSIRILSTKSVLLFSFRWQFGDHGWHQVIWNQKVNYLKCLCFYCYSNCSGCQAIEDDKDTIPDSQSLMMYARGLCVGYPRNTLWYNINRNW